MAFDKVEYDRGYRDKYLGRQEFLLPKDKKLLLKAYADSQGKTVTEIIIAALESQYGLDLSSRSSGE